MLQTPQEILVTEYLFLEIRWAKFNGHATLKETMETSAQASTDGASYVVVTLNIYDFVRGDTYSGSVLSFLGLGIHHSGLQIEEREWTFNTSGIISMPGLRMPGCRLNESIALGKFWGKREEIDAILARSGDQVRGRLVQHNLSEL